MAATLHEHLRAFLRVFLLLYIHLREIISKIIVKGNQTQTPHCVIFSVSLLLHIP
jgi:hypothetical protein